ncbi:MAG: catalase, partial [Candidatus Eisenbacteria bacterium]
LTKAKFLQDPSKRTPVFVRFSTVAGSRGSSDLARDVRGFAVKFYTEEGVYDLVGNNIPIFFIQDAMKFPDLIHAVKPEPHHEMPQAASAHDTFWDFISLMPEAMHMIMWVMSDRAIPRSLRMMEGFGIHTFRFINDKGRSRFVKFHWKPLLGMHSVAWDEAQKISGKDSDFHRRDLWEAIEAGDFPEWEFGIQVVEEKDEDKFDFDLLDPTKLIPEELVPVRRIGKLTLDRNPENFFAETEQVAFNPGNVVPGIDFSNDPLLQGRLFSYLDTQLIRLGGPNFAEIPINRPLSPVHNLQRDGHMRQAINNGRVSYEPNTLGGGCPFQAAMADGGFVSHPQVMQGAKVRARGPKFFDHFSQARLFYNSQSPPEKEHIANALRFELANVETKSIQERMVYLIAHVDHDLAQGVANALGIGIPARIEGPLNQGIPADDREREYQPQRIKGDVGRSPALSMANTVKNTIKTRRIAILAADGVDGPSLTAMKNALEAGGAMVKVVAPRLGTIATAQGAQVKVDQRLANASSVVFDATYLPGGAKSAATLAAEPGVADWIGETVKHCKAIAATGAGIELLRPADRAGKGKGPEETRVVVSQGVVVGPDAQVRKVAEEFVAAIAQHRHWEREPKTLPASSPKARG